jgi:non-ribosomal peptide synthase protein (TIGR01720 family)
LEFVGRADDQVKVRGFRVELGEVEAHLGALEGVAAAAAVVRDDLGGGGSSLVGYVVPVAGVGLDPEDLLRLLRQRVPGQLVPSRLVVLDGLPLTANAKLDRSRLPVPPVVEASAGRVPRSGAETVLCQAFTDTLHQAAHPDTDFFTHGGDSILSMQVVARARRDGLVITARQVFELRTPEALAAVAVVQVALDAGETDHGGPVGLTPMGRWLLGLGAPLDRYGQGMLVRTPADAGPARIAAALGAVVDHHALLRSRLVGAGDDAWLEVAPPATVPGPGFLTHIDASGLGADALAALVDQEAAAAEARLAPRDGVMLVAIWLDRGPGRPGRLLLVAHHLVVDGVSWRIVLDDLATADAGRDGQVSLPPVGTSVGSWVRRLAPVSAADPAEPTAGPDRAGPPDGGVALGARALDPGVDTHATAREHTTWRSVGATEPLVGAVPGAFHAGLDELLLVALALALGAAGPAPTRFAIDVEGHGRDRLDDAGVDLSRTVGWFTVIDRVEADLSGLDPRAALAGDAVTSGAVKALKDQVRRRLPAAGPSAAVLFNHLGVFGSGAGDGQDDWAPAVHPRPLVVGDPAFPLSHALEVNTVVERGPAGPRLRASWLWAPGVLDDAWVRGAAEHFDRLLDAFVVSAEAGGGGGRSPSDLTLVDLAQDEIDELEAEWGN